MGHGSNSGQSILRPIDSSEGKHQTKSYTKHHQTIQCFRNTTKILPQHFSTNSFPEWKSPLHHRLDPVQPRLLSSRFQASTSNSHSGCLSKTQRFRWSLNLDLFIQYIIYIYILKYLQGIENRWHSPYILVYKDLLPTHLLVSVPSILTLRYPW